MAAATCSRVLVEAPEQVISRPDSLVPSAQPTSAVAWNRPMPPTGVVIRGAASLAPIRVVERSGGGLPARYWGSIT
jgi:hypothetical protein